MKHQKQLLTVLLMSAASMLQAQRSETLLEKNWKFSKGDFPEAAQTDYNDTKWESVVIPHDWAIFGPFDVKNDLQNVAVICRNRMVSHQFRCSRRQGSHSLVRRSNERSAYIRQRTGGLLLAFRLQFFSLQRYPFPE